MRWDTPDATKRNELVVVYKGHVVIDPGLFFGY